MTNEDRNLMKEILQDRSFKLSIILTTTFLGTGIIFLLLGCVEFSWVLFVLLPILLGSALVNLPKRKYALAGAIVMTAMLLLLLAVPGLSGLICIVFSFALIISILCFFFLFFHLLDRYYKIKYSKDKLRVLILPLLLFFVAAPTEHFFTPSKKMVVEVKTEQIFDYTPNQVYDAIKSVDTLIAEKPFLMKFDLPIPYKCVLEKEEVGGIRTCYFSEGILSNNEFGSGTIIEKITQLEKGKVLKMDVISCNIIGRKWIDFKEAIYYFDKVGSGCKLTRITTYTSILSPRFYWEPIERLGIRQEHEYVFNSLANDLKKKYKKAKNF